MIPFLNADQVRTALPYPALVNALRTAFQGTAHSPTRHVHPLDANGNTLLIMPAWQPHLKLGVKLVTVAPGNTARQLPTLHSVFILFDADTGMPLALLDGEQLTLRRTAAASALASSYLSRADSKTLLLVGSGQLAPYMATAHCATRAIEHILLWSRTAHKAAALIPALRAEIGSNVTLRALDASEAALAAAVADADIISCATTSTVPLIRGDWLRAGTHVDLVGGFKPDMRETDGHVMQRAAVFVDTFAGALAEAGDLLQPLAAGQLQRTDILAELADLARGNHAGRVDDLQITVFKSVGAALEDLAAANLVWATMHGANPVSDEP